MTDAERFEVAMGIIEKELASLYNEAKHLLGTTEEYNGKYKTW